MSSIVDVGTATSSLTRELCKITLGTIYTFLDVDVIIVPLECRPLILVLPIPDQNPTPRC
jgi:hypothetical protein